MTRTGLFLVTLSTLAFQILLTRIFSVTIWYHFAFLAISLAMLGVTAGAIAVFLAPGAFPQARVHRRMAQSALAFAGASVASLFVHLALPVPTDGSWHAIAALAITCAVFFVPFAASGVCVALALTRFPSQVGSLYAADLVGAAVGCLSVVALLSLADGPTAVVVVAACGALGAAAFARAEPGNAARVEPGNAARVQPGDARLFRVSLTAAAGLAIFALASGGFTSEQGGLLRIRWHKSETGSVVASEPPLLERWNSHSRIRVWGDRELPRKPFGWSLSPTLPAGYDLPQLDLDIDASAYTVLTRFDGSLEPLRYLEYDVTNLAHHLRSDADVLVIGAGGARDVLSALVFEQASVLGVEVNADILDVVHGVFGDFTGHLDRHPKVRFVHDEARSFVARLRERFDIIQISLIDSWAATGAGAFVLTEHSLYTVEAWRSFLAHLAPGGILTVTRFYFAENPATAYRLVGLAARALEEQGVTEPREHLALVWLPNPYGAMCTLLVGADAFGAADLDRLDAVVSRFGFEVLLSPRHAADGLFAQLAAGGDPSQLFASFPLDITPPVDDRPFFFHMLRLRDILASGPGRGHGLAEFNRGAIALLGTLLASVALLTLLSVVLPVVLRGELAAARSAAPWLLVFAGIGAGFMMVEISQMERLIIFLGHPTYALTVVLFVLLLAGGLGSLTTARVAPEALARAGRRRFAALLAALILFGAATPAVTTALAASETPLRVGASIALLFPLGFLMGMLFPLGLRAATADGARGTELTLARGAELTPWLWGVNGATGVLASVLAIAVALTFGITAAYAVGVAAYALAACGWLWATRQS